MSQNQAMMQMMFMPPAFMDGRTIDNLLLVVSRNTILQDTLSQIRTVTAEDLKKPLRVQFHGEEADDAGGVRKEFFLLLMKASGTKRFW